MAAHWMLATGVIWGVTNALMKRGMRVLQIKQQQQQQQVRNRSLLLRFLEDWSVLLLAWEYSLPFAMNLLASVVFFVKLGDSPISLAVPVTNATTFAATAISGAILGERMHLGSSLLGLLLVVLGIVLCIPA